MRLPPECALYPSPAVAGARMGAAEEMVNKQTAAGPHITQHNTIETNLGMIHMACVYNIHCGVGGTSRIWAR